MTDETTPTPEQQTIEATTATLTAEEIANLNPILPASSDAAAPILPTESDGGANPVASEQISTSENSASAPADFLAAAEGNVSDAVIEEKKGVENSFHVRLHNFFSAVERTKEDVLTWIEKEI